MADQIISSKSSTNEGLKKRSLKSGSNGFNKSLSLKFDDSVNIGANSNGKSLDDKSNPVQSLKSLEKSSTKAKSVQSFSLNGFSFKKKQSHQIVDNETTKSNGEILTPTFQDEARALPPGANRPNSLSQSTTLPLKSGSLKKVDSETDTQAVAASSEKAKLIDSGGSLHRLVNESSKDNIVDEEADADKLAKKKKEKKVKLKSVEFLNASTPTKYDQDQSKLSLVENQSNTGDSCSNKSSSSRFMSLKNCYNYSYVVLFASFVAYMLASLLGSCFGVFFESMDSDLGWSKSQVALIGACLTALQDLTGPIASAVTNKYGCRKTAIFGGLIASLSIIAASYIEEFWLFSLLMGGVSGFGTSLVLVSSVVVVTYYFEEKPSFAAGLTISGASFGQSIFTMILIKLNNTYGRNGCFLILGAILLNMVVCGALFRPLPWELEDEEEGEDDEDEDDEEGEEEEEELEDDETDVKQVKDDGSPNDSKQLVLTKAKKSLVGETDKDEKTGKEKEPFKTDNLIVLKSENNNSNSLQAPLADKEFYESFNDYLSSLNDYNMSNYRRNSSTRSINSNNDSLSRNQNDELVALLQDDFYEDPGSFIQIRSEKDFSIIEMPRLGRSNSVFNQNSTRNSKNSNQNDQMMDASQQMINVVEDMGGNPIKISRRHSVHIYTEAQSSKNKGSMHNIGTSFIPTDTQSLKLFSSSDPDLREQPFGMLAKDPRAPNNRDENLASNPQISLQNGEFVVINADDIENCGSNLMITSPDGDIYLPIISNFDENNNFLGSMSRIGMSSPRLDRHHSNQETTNGDMPGGLYQDYQANNDDNLYNFVRETTSATDLRDRLEFEYASSMDKKLHDLSDPGLDQAGMQLQRSPQEHQAKFGGLNQMGNEYAAAEQEAALSQSQNGADAAKSQTVGQESSSRVESSSARGETSDSKANNKKPPNLLASLLNRFKLGNLVSKPASPVPVAEPKPIPNEPVPAAPKKNQNQTTIVLEPRKPTDKVKQQPAPSTSQYAQPLTVYRVRSSSSNRANVANMDRIKVITLSNNQKLAYPVAAAGSNLVGFNAPNSHKVLKHTLYENAYGPKSQKKMLLLNRCNCQQRHLQQQQANLTKKQHQRTRSGNLIDAGSATNSSKINVGSPLESSNPKPNTSVNNVNTLAPAIEPQSTTIQMENRSLIQDQPTSGQTSAAAVVGPAKPGQQQSSGKLVNPKSSNKPFRHYPNCPYYYMNHHHHQNASNLKANMFYVPNLFQNSYRFPLHFKNPYYYKSLVNLNMRLMVVKPHHGSQSAALGGVVNLHNSAKKVNANAASEEVANISLSCPDLARKQLLIMNNQNKSNNLANQAGSPHHEPIYLNINNKQHQAQMITLKDLRLLSSGPGRNRYVIVGGKNNNMNKTLIIAKDSSLNPNRRDYNNNFYKRSMSQGPNKVNLGPSKPVGVHHSRSNNRYHFMHNINDVNNQNSNLKVLNAGSIVLVTNAATGSTKQLRRDSMIKRRPPAHLDPFRNIYSIENEKIKPGDPLIKPHLGDNLEAKIIGARLPKPKYQRQRSSVGVDDELIEYSDKIVPEAKNKDEVFFDKEPAAENEDEEEEEDEEEDEEEEDEEEEDEDEEDDEDEDEEDEECDNCFTRTKAGNYVYRYVFKPVYKPLKYIGYSIVENLKLFRLFRFCIFALCNFILSLFYESPFYFINSYMTKNDLTENQAGTVTVAVGIVSVFSSIAYGYIGDSKRINSIILYSVSLILCGLCSCAIPLFIKNYWMTMLLMVLIGALISVSDVLVPIICVNIVGYDDFVSAYGLMFFCQGLASLSGPPVLGLIVDYTGSYAISYYIIGAGICFSGLILTLILIYNQCEKKEKKEKSLLTISTDKELSSNEKA